MEDKLSYKYGVSRRGILLLPECIDNYVSNDNPIRLIDEFVNNLDMVELGFDKAVSGMIGRKAYDPRDLLKLYVWGYMNRTTSSRRLERETHRNMEVMWLIGKLNPDDKTISEFRRLNKDVLKKVFVEFRYICEKLCFIKKEEVAIDGSKFKAVNSISNVYTLKRLKKRIEKCEKQVEGYLKELEENDLKEKEIKVKGENGIKEKIANISEYISEYKEMVKSLKQSGESQIALVDADSRLMDNKGKCGVCYNAQVAADSKCNMIVDFEVTNQANDQGQLAPMCETVKEAMKVENFVVLADKGYCTPEHIEKCEEIGVETYIPIPDHTTGDKKKGPTAEYDISKFTYDQNTDSYTCPQGVTLIRIGKERREYGSKDCKQCACRSECTTNKRGRTVTRNEHAEAMEKLAKRNNKAPEKLKRRGAIIEPVFGIIKNALGFAGFSVKGLAKVNAEFSLIALAYNFKRALNLVPFTVLMNCLKGGDP